jgi:hypothetical protein
MTDQFENPVLTYLRQIEDKLDRLIDNSHDLKRCINTVERQLGELRVDLAGASVRMDRLDRRIDSIGLRLDCIERRLDITPAG